MAEIKWLGSSTIKLPGFGVYVTYVDNELFISEIQSDGKPTTDAAGGVEWTKLTEPPNQEFLNIANTNLGSNFTLADFGMRMAMSDIRSYATARNKALAVVPVPLAKQLPAIATPKTRLWWEVKNAREKEK